MFQIQKLGQVIQKKTAIVVIFFLLVACSSQGSIDEAEQGIENTDQTDLTGSDEVTDETREILEMPLEELRKMYPDSHVIRAKVARSRVVATDVELSQVEREILDTLDEFNAVEANTGTMLTLPEHILFDFDSYELRSDADEVIARLVQVIEASEGNVAIVGHTDNIGDPGYNQTLSERRAQAVMGALIEQGVAEDRLEAVGMGDTQPIARNAHPDGTDDPAGRQKNRRVEVTVDGL